MKLLLYCTKAKPYLYNVLGKYIISEYLGKDFMQDGKYDTYLNGKIIGECDFEVERIHSKNIADFEKGSCLDRISMFKYLKPYVVWTMKFNEMLNTFGYLTLGYAIHIKNLKIYDEPRELSNFGLKEAPQNMCYVYEEIKHEINVKMYDSFHRVIMKPTTLLEHNKCVVISIRPEWLCKILNGEKTIEVRRKVLKEMM